MTNEIPAVTDADLLAIYIARDWARACVSQSAALGLQPFHAAHSLISEAVALIFPTTDIFAARIVATGVVATMIKKVTDMRAATAAAEPGTATTTQRSRDMTNITQFTPAQRKD